MKKRRIYFDYHLLAVVILLICFGLVMLYSASAYEAATSERFEYNDMYFFKKQLQYSAAAVIGAICLSFLNYRFFIRFSWLLYVFAFITMGLVRFSPLGVSAGGAKRWLKVGIQFQPSEIAKVAVILVMAKILVEMGKKVRTWQGTLKVLIAGAIQALGAYKLTDNLSTGIIIMAICCFMLFLSHPNTRIFFIFGAILAVLVAAALIYIRLNISDSGSFRLRRVLVWLQPEQHLSAGGYQVMQGLYAIGSGGLFGKGLGNSTQKLSRIPEAQNDMIFSVICEELGLFGALLLLILFGYLIYRLYLIAQYAPDRYGSLVASGVMIHIALQVILNISVVLNVIPTTGVTLPFISYGGSSVIFLMSEIGFVFSIAMRIPPDTTSERRATAKKRPDLS